MATYTSGSIRQGLPRSPGGPAWPDVDGAVLAEPAAAQPVAAAEPARTVATPAADVVAEPETPTTDTVILREVAESPAPVASSASTTDPGETQTVPLRRGLPRVAGGEPWPTAGTAEVAAAAPATPTVPASAEPTGTGIDTTGEAASVAHESVDPQPSKPAAATAAGAPIAGTETVSEEVTLRRGLPREPGAEPWPPAGTVSVQRAVATPSASQTEADPVVSEEPAEDSATSRRMTETAATSSAPAAQPQGTPVREPASSSVGQAKTTEDPALTRQEAQSSKSASSESAESTASAQSSKPTPPAKPAVAPKREPIMVGTRTLGQWAKLVVLWGVGAILAAGIIVLAARGVTTLPGVPEFLRRFPGEYELPDFVDPGFPAWARWSHFLNLFLIVLIIRSGLLVRMQQKPDAFFTPKKGGKKVSIYHWMHTSLDVLWLLNGVVFVVLLFVSGHWARIVPTSWEVFPNAVSAMLQYLTLEWPVEDGWVNYNSLQQLMYFVIVFIAAPLAAITGVRMSQWWPEKAERLNRAYPAPVARALHFPTMLFFVLFIIIHVFLVLTTGALKNLNHMFAGTPEISWLGFWWFVAAVFVTAVVTWAARPLVLAPIAGAFGRVSQR